MKNAIIFDLDGTLANIDHRLHYIKGGNKDWKSFYEACVNDTPIEGVRNLYYRLHASLHTSGFLSGTEIIFVSGRPEDYRSQTVWWLNEYLAHSDRHELIMRKSGDYRRDDIIKEEILKQLQAEGWNILFTIDDRQRVVDMWRRNGITCFQCAAWDEEEKELASTPGELYLMVGPSGAGKSTAITYWQACGFPGLRTDITKDMVFSSDTIRQQMCGDFRDQTKNNQVFSYIHDMVRTRSKYGLPTVVDATNIRNADRRSLRDCVSNSTSIHYVVIDRPLEQKLATAGWRSEMVSGGKPLVVKHHEVMQSNLKDILAGDNDPRVIVHDFRQGG